MELSKVLSASHRVDVNPQPSINSFHGDVEMIHLPSAPWAFKNEQALPSDDDYEQLSTSSYSNADSRSYFVVLNISEDYSVSAEKK